MVCCCRCRNVHTMWTVTSLTHPKDFRDPSVAGIYNPIAARSGDRGFLNKINPGSIGIKIANQRVEKGLAVARQLCGLGAVMKNSVIRNALFGALLSAVGVCAAQATPVTY